jgi:CCR4-NOT complex subunit CAF16
MNMEVKELFAEGVRATARFSHLIEVLQVNVGWRINELSDGQRRRCQLLECLATPRPVYLMDEITSDLDIFAREGLLGFLRWETEHRGATILYCTHIFDHLEGWATHLLHLSLGRVVRSCAIDDVEGYAALLANGARSPLYQLVRTWIYAEYEERKGEFKNQDPAKASLDGRRPNLGLAGPVCLRSG